MSNFSLMFTINRRYKNTGVSSAGLSSAGLSSAGVIRDTTQSKSLVQQKTTPTVSTKYLCNQAISDVFRGNRLNGGGCGCGKKL